MPKPFNTGQKITINKTWNDVKSCRNCIIWLIIMRVVVQRVKKASVKRKKDGVITGKIGKGYMLLIGFKKGDSNMMVSQIASKVAKLRVMSDSDDKMNLTISDTGAEILAISQFTLYADTSGGNRPSFVDSEFPDKAIKLYNLFIEELRRLGIPTETGSFGDYMEIDAELDGPVTILLEK